MRLTSSQRMEQGDTIIEVIFAIVIFSFIAIGSLTIMNKGIAVGEKALEITLVRQQINAQAEALRYLQEARVVTPTPEWEDLIDDYGQATASDYGVSGGDCLLPTGATFKPFIMNARTAEVWSSVPSVAPSAGSSFPPYPQVVYNPDSSVNEAYGIWIEAVPSSIAVVKPFVDFHIRACWPAPGTAIPMTIGTIVRLYDPS